MALKCVLIRSVERVIICSSIQPVLPRVSAFFHLIANCCSSYNTTLALFFPVYKTPKSISKTEKIQNAVNMTSMLTWTWRDVPCLRSLWM